MSTKKCRHINVEKQNVDKKKCRQYKTSTVQNVEKQNVDSAKCRQTKCRCGKRRLVKMSKLGKNQN